MATEENNETVEETAENKEPETNQDTGPAPVKKGHAGKLFVAFVVIAAAGAFAVPASREKIMNSLPALPNAEPAPAVQESQEMAVRLEQLENERDFQKAENIVATVEPTPVVPETDQKYEDLLREIHALKQQVQLLTSDTQRRFQMVRDDMPKTGLIEDNVRMLTAKEQTLSNQVVKLTDRIENMERNKADSSFVLSLSSRMLAAEQKLKASNAEKERASALLLAVYQMRDAANRGQKFLIEQQAALALASFRPALAAQLRPLTPFAEQGVWTEQALEQSYNIFADKAVLVAEGVPQNDWFHRALDSLRELVIIRRLDAPADDPSTQAVLARAGQAVARGDFTVAVLQLKALRGCAADAMAPWVSAAERMLYVRKAVNETLASVLGVIYAEKGE